jgi:hypothetical protein
MKKWEELNRLKAHQKKVQAAKTTLGSKVPNKISEIKSPYSSKSHLDPSNATGDPRLNTSNSVRSSSSKISGYYEAELDDLENIPLYKLLKYNSLQQYAQVEKFSNFILRL